MADLIPFDDRDGIIWLDGRTTRGDAGDMQLRYATFDKTHKPLGETLVDRRCAVRLEALDRSSHQSGQVCRGFIGRPWIGHADRIEPENSRR